MQLKTWKSMYGQDWTENLFQQMFMLTLYDKKTAILAVFSL